MKKTRLEKGITLVALIITIVILLILAVVSIGAVRDSGIIGHAQNATNTQTIEQEKERINLALYEWKIQKNLLENILTFKSVLEESLKDVASVDGSDNGPVTVTFEKSGNKYKVTESGTITKIANLQGTDLERYIFGQELNGRDLSEILDTEDYFFKDDSETEEDETETIGAEFITMATETSEISVVYFKVNGVNYKFAGDNNTGITDTNYGIIELEEITGISDVGKTVSYDEKKWTILYDDDENGLQMICNEMYGEFSFNANASNFVYKYNNAITTLNNECAKLFNDEKIKAVRCVGSDPRNPTNESSDNYKSDNLKNWASGNWNDVVKDTDTNYVTDFERMVTLGIYDTGGNYYWYASRLCAYDGTNEMFGIRCTVEGGTFMFPAGTLNEEGISYLDGSCYLRPVITLDKDNIILFGEGTEESPYEVVSGAFNKAEVFSVVADETEIYLVEVSQEYAFWVNRRKRRRRCLAGSGEKNGYSTVK